MNSDGSGKTSLTKNLPYGGWSASWSPDGRRIAFVTGCGENKQNPGSQIYAINADGSNPMALTDNMGDDEDPSWSPDGRVILFSSSRDEYVQIGNRISSNSEIYVMNADGSAQTNLTNHPAGDNIPSWLPVTVTTPTATPTARTHCVADIYTANPGAYCDAYARAHSDDNDHTHARTYRSRRSPEQAKRA